MLWLEDQGIVFIINVWMGFCTEKRVSPCLVHPEDRHVWEEN